LDKQRITFGCSVWSQDWELGVWDWKVFKHGQQAKDRGQSGTTANYVRGAKLGKNS